MIQFKVEKLPDFNILVLIERKDENHYYIKPFHDETPWVVCGKNALMAIKSFMSFSVYKNIHVVCYDDKSVNGLYLV